MPQRLWKLFPLLLVMLSTLAFAYRMPSSHFAVIRIKSVDALVSGIKHLLKQAGQENYAEQVDDLIKALVGEKGLRGIDPKRPLGLYFAAREQSEEKLSIVGFVPVSSQEEFLNLLQEISFEPKRIDGEIYTVDAPLFNTTLYLRFANQHAYLSNDEGQLRSNLPEPAKLAPTGVHEKSLITASISIDQIPSQYKQTFLQDLEKNLEQEKAKKEAESDVQHKARLAGMRMAKDVINVLAQETRELTLGLDIDEKQNNLALDVSLIAKPGSRLAASLQSFGNTPGSFGHLVNDAALSLLVHVPLAEELQRELGEIFDQAVHEGLKEVEDAQLKAVAEKFYKAIEPTLKGDLLDFGASLRGPLSDKKYVVVAGLKVKEGKNVERVLRELVDELPEADKATVKLDHARHGDTTIHLIQPTSGLDEQGKKLFGTIDIHVALRDDLALVTIGQHGMTVMKEALDGLRTAAPVATAPIQLEASISKLVPFFESSQPQLAEAIRKVFADTSPGRDKVRLSVHGGDALRLRLDVPGEIIKVLIALSPFGDQ